MEQELGIPTQLFGGPPVRDNMLKMAESQIGFIQLFARPLFENVAKLMPGMHFAVDEILRNCDIWEARIREEKALLLKDEGNPRDNIDDSGLMSPRSGTPPDMEFDGASSVVLDRPFTSNGHPIGSIDPYTKQRADIKPEKRGYLFSSSTTDVAGEGAKRKLSWRRLWLKFK